MGYRVTDNMYFNYCYAYDGKLKQILWLSRELENCEWPNCLLIQYTNLFVFFHLSWESGAGFEAFDGLDFFKLSWCACACTSIQNWKVEHTFSRLLQCWEYFEKLLFFFFSQCLTDIYGLSLIVKTWILVKCCILTKHWSHLHNGSGRFQILLLKNIAK